MHVPAERLAQMTASIERLERQVRRQRWALTAVGLIGGGMFMAAAAPAIPDVIQAHAIRIVDASGKPRILIGAPTPGEGRKRQDAQTASIVVLGPDGSDRLVLGEEPGAMIGGKVYPRIHGGYGLLLHNAAGDERGSVSYLDNGRGIISLDRPGGDAVEMVTNEESGFAGLTVNYASTLGRYAEGIRIGTKNDTAWISLEDRAGGERARLAVSGKEAPKLVAQPAGARPAD